MKLIILLVCTIAIIHISEAKKSTDADEKTSELSKPNGNEKVPLQEDSKLQKRKKGKHIKTSDKSTSVEEPFKKSHKKKVETKNVDKKVNRKVKSKKGKKELDEEVYVTETKEVKEPVTKSGKKKNSHQSKKQHKKNVEKVKMENTQKFDENSKNELEKNSEIDSNKELNEETIFSEVHKEETKKTKKPKKYEATDRTKRSLEETESENLGENQAVLDMVEENTLEQE